MLKYLPNIFKLNILVMVLSTTISTTIFSSDSSSTSVHQYSDNFVHVPIEALSKKSLIVSSLRKDSLPDRSFEETSSQDHINTFGELRKIIDFYKSQNLNQYLIIGENRPNINFEWEIVPYEHQNFKIIRFWNQFLTIWRTIFGKTSLNNNQRNELSKYFSFSKRPFTLPAKDKTPARSKDPFCQKKVIEKQCIFSGEKMTLLYNYAPICLDNNKLHFLVVTKNHRKNFSKISQEEYLEAMEITKIAIKYLREVYSAKDIYIFHKTGADAGQTVNHFHIHILATSIKTQTFLDKCIALKNIIFSQKILNENELHSRVSHHRKFFKKYMD